MRRFSWVIVAVCLTAAPWTSALAEPVRELLHQTVSVDGHRQRPLLRASINTVVTASMSIFRASRGSTVHIACLSSHRDLRYELRDSSGKVVPINEQALKPYGESTWAGPVYVKGKGKDVPCADQEWQQTKLVTILAPLYPDLAPGTYTLQITFAPRGHTHQARFAPIRITVDNQHLL